MTNFKRAMLAAVTAASLMGSQAIAADMSLAPGKPAGVEDAQRGSHLLLIGGAAILAVIAIVIASQQPGAAPCGSACTVPAAATTS
jgi:hypothetical protein